MKPTLERIRERLKERRKDSYESRNEDNYNYNKGLFRAYDVAITIIDEEAKRGDWVPVEERLPKERGSYPVTMLDMLAGERLLARAYFNGKYFANLDWQRVVAWRHDSLPWRGE